MDLSIDYSRRVRSSSASGATPSNSSMILPHNAGGMEQHPVHGSAACDTVHSGDYVPRRLEQPESVLGVAQDASSVDAHFNHTELAGWIECMIDELSPWQQSTPTHPSYEHSPTPTHSSFSTMESTIDSFDSSNHAALPVTVELPTHALVPDMYTGQDLYNGPLGGLYQEEGQAVAGAGADTAVTVEESGVRLVHLLLACAQAVQCNDGTTAEETVRRIQTLAAPQRGPIGKVAAHFVDALARRIFGISAVETVGDPLAELLHFQFYETCPYLKFAHFTANQAILEAVQSHKRIHVIDCNLKHGLQWPALIQALALRPGGPPVLRLTGIGPPHPSGNDVLQEIGQKLAQLAESVNVQFEFRGVYAQKLDDVKPWMLNVRQGEAVAVNAVMQFHRLLDNSNCASPAVEEVLRSVRSLNPKILTVVEHEANHNSPVFLDRFMEALHYYSTMFDSLETCNNSNASQGSELLLAEMYMGREICNIVACEGSERVERHESLAQWRQRIIAAGFQLRHLGQNAFKQASMLLTLFSGDGFRVQENNGALTLGWHERPLIAASAWHCA